MKKAIFIFLLIVSFISGCTTENNQTNEIKNQENETKIENENFIDERDNKTITFNNFYNLF